MDRNKYISEDLNHFSVKAHAAAAAVAWTTMKQRGVIARRSSAAAVVSSSGHDGLIAFIRPGTVGEFDLWTVRPDGRRLQRLTESPTNRSDYNLTWSPDGATVLFERRFLNGGTDGDDLYTVRPNGSAIRQLTRPPAGYEDHYPT